MSTQAGTAPNARAGVRCEAARTRMRDIMLIEVYSQRSRNQATVSGIAVMPMKRGMELACNSVTNSPGYAATLSGTAARNRVGNIHWARGCQLYA